MIATSLILYAMRRRSRRPSIGERCQLTDRVRGGVKEALRDRLWLRKDPKPILSYIGRLDQQKGIHLIHHGIFYAPARGMQVVVMGKSSDPDLNAHFWHLKHFLNDNPDCHL